jgi:hypothetical protein
MKGGEARFWSTSVDTQVAECPRNRSNSIAGMASTYLLRFATGFQPLPRILVDRLQHHEARLVRWAFLLAQQALVAHLAR